jgi:phospholipase D1/2
MIVDDELLTLGSANMSNRSLGLDTEANVAIEARGDPKVAGAIAGLRERLLAEHLDVQPEDVAREFARRGGVVATIDALRGRERTLLQFQPPADTESEAGLPDPSVVDPERPIEAELLVEALLPPEVQPSIRERVELTAMAALGLILLIVAWHWGGLRDSTEGLQALALLEAFREWPWAVPAACAAFLLCAFVPVPIVVLAAVAAWIFGAWVGLAIAVPMSIAAAFAGYGVGVRLGRSGVQRVGGHHMNRLARRLANGGVAHVVLLRVLPAAPFNQTNWVVGASRIGFRDFALGTVLGLAPTLGMTVLVAERARLALEHPGAFNVLALAGLVALVVAVAMFVARRIVRPGARAAPPPGTMA